MQEVSKQKLYTYSVACCRCVLNSVIFLNVNIFDSCFLRVNPDTKFISILVMQKFLVPVRI
jgi:hypothetical protein